MWVSSMASSRPSRERPHEASALSIWERLSWLALVNGKRHALRDGSIVLIERGDQHET